MTMTQRTQPHDMAAVTAAQQSLARLEDVRVDTALPAEERLRDYLNQIRDPYCFLCGTTPVRIRFASGEPDLREKLKMYFLRLER